MDSQLVGKKRSRSSALAPDDHQGSNQSAVTDFFKSKKKNMRGSNWVNKKAVFQHAQPGQMFHANVVVKPASTPARLVVESTPQCNNDKITQTEIIQPPPKLMLMDALRQERNSINQASTGIKSNAARFTRQGTPMPTIRDLVVAPHVLSAEKHKEQDELEVAVMNEAVGTLHAKSRNASAVRRLRFDDQVTTFGNPTDDVIREPCIAKILEDQRITTFKVTGRLGGNVESIVYDRSKLPIKFCMLLDQLDALESAVTFIQVRKQHPCVSALAPMIERTCRRSFSPADLQKLAFVLFDCVRIMPARGKNQEDYVVQLIDPSQAKRSSQLESPNRFRNSPSQVVCASQVSLLSPARSRLNAAVSSPAKSIQSPQKVSGKSLIARRTLLHQRLLYWVFRAHQEHLGGKAPLSSVHSGVDSVFTYGDWCPDFARSFLDNVPAVWDDTFDLESMVPDLPFVCLAQISRRNSSAPVVHGDELERTMSSRNGSERLSLVSAVTSEKEARIRLHEQSSFASVSAGTIPEGSGDIPESLLLRVRRREQAMADHTQVETMRKQQALRTKLVETADSVKAIFNRERKVAMSHKDLVHRILASRSVSASTQDNAVSGLERELEELFMEASGWIICVTSKVSASQKIVRIKDADAFGRVRDALAKAVP